VRSFRKGSRLELRNISMGDLWLYEATLCNPEMMAELGGPRPREGLEDKLRTDVEATAADRYWMLVIVLDGGSDTPAGHISVWDHEWNGGTITEMGWMVLPRFQGRGVATEAARAVLDRARTTGRWSVVHAFPAVTNAPSNAICRKVGFELVGPIDYEYKGNVLRTNHWRLDLTAASA
jgi:RimJ/RimL family protein N-acetyltransferase